MKAWQLGLLGGGLGLGAWLGCQGIAEAYPVNFGTSYVPSPAHGTALSHPSMALDGRAFGTRSYVGFGVADKLSVGVDTLYLAVPGVGRDWGNSHVYLNYNLGAIAPGVSARLTQVVGFRTGAFGSPKFGIVSFVDWSLSAPLTMYTSVGYSFEPAGSGHRYSLNSALDYRFLPWLSVDLELLAGTPFWDFGPATRLGIAPGLTFYGGPVTLQASLRVPVLATGPTRQAPILVLGWAYGW